MGALCSSTVLIVVSTLVGDLRVPPCEGSSFQSEAHLFGFPKKRYTPALRPDYFYTRTRPRLQGAEASFGLR